MEEAVALELVFLAGDNAAVAVAMHVKRGATPVKSFGSPLSHVGVSSASEASSIAARVVWELAEAVQAAGSSIDTGGTTSTSDLPADGQQAVEQEVSSAGSQTEEQGTGSGNRPSQLEAAVELGNSSNSTELPASTLPAASTAASAQAVVAPEPSRNTLLPLFEECHGAAKQPAAGSTAAATTAGAEQLVLPAASEGTGTLEYKVAEAGGDESAAALDAVMSMLQELLEDKDQGSSHAQQALLEQEDQPALPSSKPPVLLSSPRAAARSCGSGGVLPGGVKKLLALELEVVQLQQSLQIAQLEFETRSMQLHHLKQRADEADQQAQAAEERASSLGQQVRALQRQAGELRHQHDEAAARHQQERTHLAAQLAVVSSKQQISDEEAVTLRQHLAAARSDARLVFDQLNEAAGEQAAWQERAAALKKENQQLRVHVAAACGALKALGIPAHKVFSRAALALAGHASSSSMQSPPDSPTAAESVYYSPASETASLQQQLARPPQVPRLQLSSISLGQLQRHVAEQQQQQQQQQGVVDQQPLPPQQPAPTAAAQPAPLLGPGSQQQRQPENACIYAHAMVSGSGAAAPGLPAAVLSETVSSAETSVYSPVASCRQHALPLSPLRLPAADLAPPLLTSRRAVSPAQQELLATARQWQQSARFSRSAMQVELPDQADAFIPAYRLHQQHTSATATAAASPAPQCPPATARPARAPSCWPQQTPHPRRGTVSATDTPNGKLQRHQTYGRDPGFQEIKQAYQAVVAGEADRARSWARSVFSSSSAVESEPRKVEPVVQGLLKLFYDNGVRIPLAKCGPCQYRLGTAKLSVRLVSGRLMARAGAGQTIDIFSWLEKQPVLQQH